MAGGELCLSALLAGMLAGSKLIVHSVHNYPLTLGVLKFQWKTMAYVSAKCTDLLVTVSAHCEKSFKDIKSVGETKFIWNGIDPSSSSQQTSAEKKDFILIAAVLENRKGHAWLFEAFSKLQKDFPELTLICAGYGSTFELAARESEAKRHGILEKVEFIGHVKNIEDYYKSARLVVVPSLLTNHLDYQLLKGSNMVFLSLFQTQERCQKLLDRS